MKYKQNGAGEITGRLVVGGHKQDKSNLTEVSSPTVKAESILILLNIAAYEQRKLECYDVKGAFLNATLTNENGPVYMKIQKEVATILLQKYPEYADARTGNLYVQLNKALCGLVQSPVLWYNNLQETLTTAGYKKSVNDACLFLKESEKGKTMVTVHVVDLLISATTDEMLVEMKKLGFANSQEFPGWRSPTESERIC